MTKNLLVKPRKFGAALAALTVISVNAATAQETSDWQYELMIYGWFPDVDGTLKYAVPSAPDGKISVDVDDIIDKLEMTFMGTFEARRDKWSLLADVVYLDLGDDNDTLITAGPGPGLGANVDQSIEAWVVTGAVGYNAVHNDQSRLDLLGGVRYLSANVDAKVRLNGPLPKNPPPAELSDSEELWDGIIGVKGNIMLNERWYLPYYADIGTGDSDLTWQALAGVGYRFDWGDVKLAYRHLSYDQEDDKLLQDIEFSGPALGVSFRF